MNLPTKLTPAVAAAHKAERLAANRLKMEPGRKIKVQDRHCKQGHEWSVNNTAYKADGRRVCISCSENNLKAMELSPKYLIEEIRLAELKNTADGAQSCARCSGILVDGKCAPCYRDIRTAKYRYSMSYDSKPEISRIGASRKKYKEFFYFAPEQGPSPGTYEHWIRDNGIKVKRPATEETVDFDVFNDKDDMV